ncbi:MAG: demethoxyubiquinone hydroxylase family protein [Armatimonadota bacterium]
MDFTDPFVATDRRKLDKRQLAQAIRIDMAAELDAINLYVAHVESIDDPVIKGMIQHIIDEEKEHFSEFEQLLYLLDDTQLEKTGEAYQEVEERKKAA